MHCPLEVLAERDVKGLYKKALAGEIEQLHRRLRPVRGAAGARGGGRLVEGEVEDSVEQIVAKLRELGYVDYQTEARVA